jgi:hypothetical protein
MASEKIEGERCSDAAAKADQSNGEDSPPGQNHGPHYDVILTFFFALACAAAHAGPKSGITGAPT